MLSDEFIINIKVSLNLRFDILISHLIGSEFVVLSELHELFVSLNSLEAMADALIDCETNRWRLINVIMHDAVQWEIAPTHASCRHSPMQTSEQKYKIKWNHNVRKWSLFDLDLVINKPIAWCETTGTFNLGNMSLRRKRLQCILFQHNIDEYDNIVVWQY